MRMGGSVQNLFSFSAFERTEVDCNADSRLISEHIVYGVF